VEAAVNARRHRLAFLTSHPIQYQAPLFRRLTASPSIDLTVFFCLDQGLRRRRDPEFGVAVEWDTPLAEGYRYRILSNWSLVPRSGRFWGALNPGIVAPLCRGRFDAIVVHGWTEATHWLAFLAAGLTGTPLLLHGEAVPRPGQVALPSRMRRALVRVVARHAAACLANGTRGVEFYRALGVPAERIALAPYSVDNVFFQQETKRWRTRRAELRAGLGLPPELPVILFPSKLIERKRPMDCLLAYAALREDAALVFVGDGALRPALEAEAAELGLSHVRFAGFQNQSALPRYYALADVLVLPSTFEPWGLVVNEAMCAGLPVVASDGVTAAADLVRHGENGFVYPAGDVGALAGCLRTLVCDQLLRESMGVRSAQIIETWSHRECVEAIVGVLDRLGSRQQETAESVTRPSLGTER
jgi:glycosyltransferase involved in cell wall biosynthesis